MEQFDREMAGVFRAVSISRRETETPVTDAALVRAVALNDSLIDCFNITFRPEDLLKIVRHNAGDEIMEKLGDIFENSGRARRARTMYTAKQARTIDEAVFRFHQFLHYMSTYGAEFFTGEKVSAGWLPSSDDSDTEYPEDKTIVNAACYAVVFDDEKYEYVFKTIAGRRNRATLQEKSLLKEAVKHISAETVSDTGIAFRENIVPVFINVFDTFDGADRKRALTGLCANTNDVLKCAEQILNIRHWNLRTSEKRALVQILESFDISDFAGNLMYSNKRREKNLRILKHLSYNTCSRSAEHRIAVDDLRNDRLKSWEGKIKAALAEGDRETAMRIAASRPGNVIRMANWLLKNGIEAQAIEDSIRDRADVFSTQTLVENINAFSMTEKENLAVNRETLTGLMKSLLKASLQTKTTPIRGKKVFLENEDFDLSKSVLNFNKKAPSGSFIASGLARRIDFTDARFIRIFTYWESDVNGERVDIDLHGFCRTSAGEKVHVGWNSDHRGHGVYMSGDITHSDPYGAEFIDIDLETTDVEAVSFTLNSFRGQHFKNIRNLMVGILPVSGLNETEERSSYSPKNCLFTHNLDFDAASIVYGTVDVKNRVLYFDGTLGMDNVPDLDPKTQNIPFSLEDYLRILMEAQSAVPVEKREDAEVVLILSKPGNDSEICLIDENYFADCR